MKKRILQFFQEISLSKRLTYVLLFYTICLIAVVFISYSSMIHLMQSKTIENTQILGEQTTAAIESIIGDALSTADIPNRSSDIQSFLIQSNNIAMYTMNVEEKKEVYRRELDFIRSLKVYNNLGKGSNSLYIFNRDGRAYYDKKNSQTSAYTREDYITLQNLLYKARTQGVPIVILNQVPAENHSKTFYTFSVLREIRDLYTQEVLGMVVAETDVSVVEDALEKLNSITKGKVTITEANADEQRTERKQSWNQKIFDMWMPNPEYYDAAKQAITIEVPSKLYNWKLSITVPVHQLVSDITQIQVVLLGAIVFLMCITILVILLISKNIVTPLQGLMRKMRSIKETDDLKATFNTDRKDEIGQLYLQFNSMFQNIRELMLQTKQMERKHREVELDALQGQINPHFIYNTLETIRMNAEMHDDEETGDMIYQLSQLMRYSMKRGFETCTLGEELQYVENYMKLMNFRFGNQFMLHLQTEEIYRGYPVMKMLLQPLVENATMHGYDSNTEKMNITISCKRTEEAFYLYIKDDGVGMSEERLTQVRNNLKTEQQYPIETQKKSIGLRNVNERIQVLYGKMYGLQVYSVKGAGTTVEVKLPCVMGRE
ncbi:sensor histidine kinase [Ectobacillus sp. JY-23]|uniref:sensor histidine kinase n=1 Tax=Ectobacillus sp. JY-23 TaxID=2933872 RepID=UPI001FF5697F|nr:sensor histidine kinase [Ectobacillus sp. JY-23]UOY92235.1 sensor histidine kinase [Ectobacillus sp. JY-23]